jgi:hypothetical protein
MTLGDNNRAAIVLILVLVLGASGYLWFTKMYQPAVAANVAAKAATDTATQQLTAAQADLKKATDTAAAQKSAAGKPDDSVARLALVQQAVSNKTNLGDATIVLKHIADRSGISTTLNVGSTDQAAATVAPTSGATPMDVTFKAAGSYAQMMTFMQRVQDTVTVDKGKLHVRGRLFNVMSLEIGGPDAAAGNGSSGNPALDGIPGASDVLVIRPGDISFTIVVRFYSSTSANSQSVGAAGAAATSPTTGTATATPNTAASPAGASTTGTASTDTPTTNSTGAAGAPAGTGASDSTAAASGGAQTTTPVGGT